MDKWTKLLLTLIALLLSCISLVELGVVQPAHAVSTNVAVTENVSPIRRTRTDYINNPLPVFSKAYHQNVGPRGLARGWLDLPVTLQPVEDSPTKGRPGGTDTPAGEHVGGIVNTEIDTTDADGDGE